MSSFTNPLVISPLMDGRNWKLVEPFDYHIGSEDSGETIEVPAGFVTDFASIPRFFWAIIPPWGRYGKAAIVHDYGYRTHLHSKKQCDEIFKEGMKVLKVPVWKKCFLYWAVNLFGYWAYKSGPKRLRRQA